MRLVFSVLGGVILGLSPATAQDIRWQSETFSPGDYVTIDRSELGPIHHVFLGETRLGFQFDSFEGDTPEGTPVFTTYLDEDGNYLRWVRADGYEIQYIPNDCTRVLGFCDYAQVGSDGAEELRSRWTEATEQGFSFREYIIGGDMLFEGEMALDERGMAGDGWLNSASGALTYRLLHQSYR